MTVDFRQDAVAVHTLLEGAVRDYSARHVQSGQVTNVTVRGHDQKTLVLAASAAKEHPPVTRIDLIFSLGDSESTPWVHLHFDTKPGSEPDGDPTHPDFARLERESWLPAVQAVCAGQKVAVIKLDGQIQECDDAGFEQQIGEFLVSALLDARAKGLLASLPRAQRCELGVEDPTTGDFGWPAYEDRGKENLV